MYAFVRDTKICNEISPVVKVIHFNVALRLVPNILALISKKFFVADELHLRCSITAGPVYPYKYGNKKGVMR